MTQGGEGTEGNDNIESSAAKTINALSLHGAGTKQSQSITSKGSQPQRGPTRIPLHLYSCSTRADKSKQARAKVLQGNLGNIGHIMSGSLLFWVRRYCEISRFKTDRLGDICIKYNQETSNRKEFHDHLKQMASNFSKLKWRGKRSILRRGEYITGPDQFFYHRPGDQLPHRPFQGSEFEEQGLDTWHGSDHLCPP